MRTPTALPLISLLLLVSPPAFPQAAPITVAPPSSHQLPQVAIREDRVIDIAGYFRTRFDLFENFDLNRGPTPSTGQPIFPVPASDPSGALASGNMRLRLEPTIHVTDTIKIHAQVDLLDNLVLGSTPDSFAGDNPYAPIDLLTRTQLSPQEGINSFNDSITVKRAWGEVRFGFGMTLEFGRMPNHWGLGIVQNDGNGYARGEQSDIIRMVDTDYGDSVDTVRLSFDFGPDKRNAITLGVSYDWAASGPTTAQLLGPRWASGNLLAQTFSAELYDNVHQVSLWVERHDDPSMLRRKLSSGVPVVNYGLKTWMRWQSIDRAIGAPGLGDGLDGDPYLSPDADLEGLYHAGVPLGTGGIDEDGEGNLQRYANSLVHRRGWMLTPDVWLRINWRTMRIEAEGAVVLGSFQRRDLNIDRNSSEFDVNVALPDELSRVLQGGYALEFKYGLFRDRFHIGFDHGFASGDSSPPYQYAYQSPFAVSGGDNDQLNTFRFNPAYAQDLLLFRELLGTVANAAYIKPWAAFYFFQNNVSARADVEFAGAVDRRGTLAGDKSLWGLELAGSARYHDAEEPLTPDSYRRTMRTIWRAAVKEGRIGLDEARKAMILTKTLWRAELETSAFDEVKRK